MRIGRITVSPINAAKLHLRDWYSYHILFEELFKDTHAFRLWHFCGRTTEGLQFVFLADADPVSPPKADLDIEVKTFPEAFLTRDDYRFDVRISMAKWAGGKKIFVPEDEVLERFAARSSCWGFEPSELRLADTRSEMFRHGGSSMLVAMYDITGRLRVTDHAVFRRAALAGIGAKLSFGCGLLRLYRADL